MEAKRELNNPYRSKLDSANLLILGMEGLRPGRLVPVSQAAVEDAGTKKDAFERQKYAVTHTCIVLYGVPTVTVQNRTLRTLLQSEVREGS